jgi:hypothetical protein
MICEYARRTIIAALALAGCAQTPTTELQPLEDALIEWAQQTGYQIIVPADDRTQRPVRRVRVGDPLGTLEALLEGTGLGWEMVNERTVVVR